MAAIVYAVSVPIGLAVMLHVIGKAVTFRWSQESHKAS